MGWGLMDLGMWVKRKTEKKMREMVAFFWTSQGKLLQVSSEEITGCVGV